MFIGNGTIVSEVSIPTYIPLPNVQPGSRVRVHKLEAHPALCNRLRELGFCELSEIKILRNAGSLLCQVCGSRVCISKQLADSILVEKPPA